MSMLIYFCDHSESEMKGGELLLHDAQRKDAVVARISPQHNLMIAFLQQPFTPFRHADYRSADAAKLPSGAHFQLRRYLA